VSCATALAVNSPWKKCTGDREVNRATLALCLMSVIAFSPSLTFAQELADGKRLYQAYCSGCHGLSGKGDGPAAKTLPVKPADHTRIEMNKYTDQYLIEIISKGGASVGRSAQIPAWGAVLKEPQVREIVAYVRALSNGKKETAQASGVQNK
jgi:mono/diheme cytochrome c family protein